MNVTQTLNFLKYSPISQAILITGAHGIGKSEVVRQAAKEMGGGFVDMRLSQNDVGDLKGMPFLANGRTFFAPPDWFPMDENSAERMNILLTGIGQKISEGQLGPKGILFLDEFNRATRECEQAAFELVLDRRLNMISLPPGWRVVAAINDDSEIYNVNDMEPALLSRFAVIPFVPSVDEWLSWAKVNDVHEAVYQFITKQPESLDVKKDMLKNQENRNAKLYDRRSWTKLSITLKEFEKKNTKWLTEETEYRVLVFMSFIGSRMTTVFNNFIVNEYVTLNANKILNDWDKETEKHLKKAKVVEMGGYNRLLVEYMKSDKEIMTNNALSKTQGTNLYNYINATPNEIGADFWTEFNKELPKVSDQWYSKTTNATNLILKRLASPEARKRQGIAD